ncbi:MAG: protease complex subunit PrcB family protein [Lachnospiraceae bacterium]|nr:protease complex subunit PrcB family protein [Lachnospiraceae bacterium]
MMMNVIKKGMAEEEPDKRRENCRVPDRSSLKGRYSLLLLAVCICVMALLTACSVSEVNSGAGEKVEDLDYTILDEDRIPEELLPLIEERYEEAFQMTYTDNEYLYVCIGYGKQDNSGYTIVVNDFFLGENGVLVDTSLLGPAAGEERINEAQYPYIVLRTEAFEEEVPMYWK